MFRSRSKGVPGLWPSCLVCGPISIALVSVGCMATATSRCVVRPCKLNGRILLLPKRDFREFYDDISTFSQKKMSTADVNRRIFEGEFYCFPRNKKLGFTANQVDVNRPVEDRWSAYRLGGAMVFNDRLQFNSSHPLYPLVKDFPGGHLFTAVDGHAGHTCAHAVNLLHPDYLTAAMLPHHLIPAVLANLEDVAASQSYTPPAIQVCELSQPYLTDADAFMTTSPEPLHADGQAAAEMEEVEEDVNTAFLHGNRTSNWRLCGQWGGLDAQVNQRRSVNIRRLLRERLKAGEREEESDGDCVMHANGNIYDREGFLISEGSELPAANPEGTPGDRTTLSTVSTVASMLRRGMTRLDSDITSDGIPDPTKGLNKSLLRIVLSGCVATSVYIPNSQDVVYVAQVGDCGAVLGRYLGELTPEAPPTALSPTPPIKSFPKTFNKDQWNAEFLVQSHTAHNAADVGRLQSQHPIHEADLLISEDRLLGELMPLRAFGDIRYKLPANTLKQIARLLGMPPNYPVCPRFYHSPPYLVSTPQVVCRKLTPARDRFIILATDGLWDMLSPEEAVQVVAQHLIDYKGDPSHAGPRDTAASRLIRTALGGESMDTSRIAMHLSVPANVARFYRDDITVLVIYPNM
ncbi:[Pyruvate dehydrogenase [acetyl-transferring]]-phosphatase 1, mitochondrial [Sparganum proliferum]